MPGYSITVSAADAASNVLDGINGRLAALNKRAAAGFAPFTRLGDSVAKFAQVSGIDKIAGGIAEVGKQGRHAAVSLFRVLEPLGIIGGAASLAGIYKLTTAWGDFGAQLDISARRAGMSAASLYRLQGAAQLVNVSGETLASGMESLNDNLRNASFGGGAQFLATLRSIGVDFEALKRAAPEKRIELLTAALSKVKNVTDRKLFTGILFGSDAILPLMELTGKGLREVLGEADKLRGVYSPADVKNANAFNLAQTRLRLSIGGVGSQIATVLAPVLTPLLNSLTNAAVYTRRWMEANQAWLRGEISREIERFATWLRGIDWPGIWQAMQRIAARANAVAESLGGWERVGEGVLAFMAGRFLIKMLMPFLQLGLAVGRIANLMRLAFVTAFGEAGVAAAGFSLKTMGLPIFKLLGRAGGLLSLLSLSGDTPDGPKRQLSQSDIDEIWRQTGGPQVQPTRDNPLGVGSWAPSWLGGTPDVKPIPLKEQKERALASVGLFMKEGGLTAEGAAALVGGSIQESGLNTQAGRGTGHQGKYQWMKSRREAIEKQFGKAVIDMTSAEQDRAALWELRTKPEYRAIYNTFKTSHNLFETNDAATGTFENPYEKAKEKAGIMGPGNRKWELPRRYGLSAGVLAALPEGEPLAAPTGAPGPAGASGRVQMNVNVTGQPAQVSARASGGIDLNIAQPGLIGAM